MPGVEVDDIGTTAKTMPEFPQIWQRMLDGEHADGGRLDGGQVDGGLPEETMRAS
ncbi:hypothetical protein D3C87_2195070 [compost metagenome]